MKILMIDSLVGNDYTFWLCQGLSEAGHDITLITTQDRASGEDFSFHVLPVSPSKDKSKNKFLKLVSYIYYLIWLLIYILYARADIVHFQFFRRERIECLYFPLLRFGSKQLVFTAHNILPHEHGKIDYYLRYLVYKAADKIIVHTPRIKKKLLDKFTINSNKVFVIPAIKPQIDHYDSGISKSRAREKLQLAEDAKVLLFLGFIREYKGVDLLLEAFDIARATHKDLQLLVCGNPQPESLRTVYKTQIENMAHGESVTLRAEYIPQDEVDYYFRAVDALALPYKHIDYSAILQEAFAYGLPVLATDTGNFADFIENGINGYVSDEISPESFSRIITSSFEDMTQLAQMGENAFHKNQEYPDWEEICQFTIHAYDKDLEGAEIENGGYSSKSNLN